MRHYGHLWAWFQLASNWLRSTWTPPPPPPPKKKKNPHLHRPTSLSMMAINLQGSSSTFKVRSLGFTIFGEKLVHVTFFVCFFVQPYSSHILSSWMMHAGNVFVAGIQLSSTWTSGSFQSMRWSACVPWQDLSLCSHLKEFEVCLFVCLLLLNIPATC